MAGDISSHSHARQRIVLHRVFDDGTTQYTYEGGTVVTILPDGEVLLLPEEI